VGDNPLVLTIQSGVPDLVKEVQVYRDGLEHIQKAHPLEAGAFIFEQVQNTIRGEYSRIYESQTPSGKPALLFVNDKVQSGSSGNPLRVAVKIPRSDGIGILTTAHFQGSTPSGRLLLKGGNDEES
jgi:hypothetical protein